jgi:hypothetical protein
MFDYKNLNMYTTGSNAIEFTVEKWPEDVLFRIDATMLAHAIMDRYADIIVLKGGIIEHHLKPLVHSLEPKETLVTGVDQFDNASDINEHGFLPIREAIADILREFPVHEKLPTMIADGEWGNVINSPIDVQELSDLYINTIDEIVVSDRMTQIEVVQ